MGHDVCAGIYEINEALDWRFPYQTLKEGGSIYIACSYHNIEVMIVLKQLNFKINNVITWQKEM